MNVLSSNSHHNKDSFKSIFAVLSAFSTKGRDGTGDDFETLNAKKFHSISSATEATTVNTRSSNSKKSLFN